MTHLLEESFVEYGLVAEEIVDTGHARVTYALMLNVAQLKKVQLINIPSKVPCWLRPPTRAGLGGSGPVSGVFIPILNKLVSWFPFIKWAW